VIKAILHLLSCDKSYLTFVVIKITNVLPVHENVIYFDKGLIKLWF